uniref:Uncharacterized protein n=1 Tax=Cacopsylla melanoneura TaxID=428564 RepID=A0A8D8ZMH2_9HEMI
MGGTLDGKELNLFELNTEVEGCTVDVKALNLFGKTKLEVLEGGVLEVKGLNGLNTDGLGILFVKGEYLFELNADGVVVDVNKLNRFELNPGVEDTVEGKGLGAGELLGFG